MIYPQQNKAMQKRVHILYNMLYSLVPFANMV